VPFGFGTAGVSTITSWSDGDPGVTVLEDSLDRPTGELNERLRPTEGDCDVSPLSFVIHDIQSGAYAQILTALFTRDIESISKTVLTSSVTASSTSFVVADPSIFGVTPSLDAWINGECVRVTARAGSTLTVTRGRYGSRARAIEVNSNEGINPEIFLSCPELTRRRCVLYRVVDGVATIRYIGYADHAPRLNEDGLSWTISTTHVATRELGVTLGSAAGNTRNVGYDDACVSLIVERADASGIVGASGRASSKATIHASFNDMMTAACRRLQNSLVTAGASNVSVQWSPVGPRGVINVSASGIGAFTLRVRVADLEAESSSSDTGSAKRARVELVGYDRGAVTRFGWQPYAAPPVTDSARVTVLALSPSLDTTASLWATSTSSGDVPVVVTPVLTAPWDNDYRLVLDTREQTSPYWATGTTLTTASHTTLRARAYLRAQDAAVAQEPEVPAAGLLQYRGVMLFQREYLVQSSNWLYALQWVLDTGISDENDSRNWDWSQIAVHAAATGSGTVAAVDWRIAADRRVGEFVVDECALRAACLSVRAGKLCVVAVRQPTASETVTATITDDNLRGDGDAPRAQLEQWEDGVVTAVQIASPLRDVRVIDQVARARYGDGRTISLRAEGLRNQRGAIDDPVAWARAIAQRPLRLWSQPVYLVRLPVTQEFRDAIELGDMIEVSVTTLPDGAGERGMLQRRAQVIGRAENLDTGDLTFEALLFSTAYGYAPCAKVDSISGATIYLVSDAGFSRIRDYAGSFLATYDGTANDGGASKFAVGDVVELVQRNAYSPAAPEQRTVVAVTPAGPSITLDAAPSAGWGALSWVDLRTAAYSVCVTDQKTKWAFACDSTTPQEIAAGVEGRKWAT
jgi:hypothetical protein